MKDILITLLSLFGGEVVLYLITRKRRRKLEKRVADLEEEIDLMQRKEDGRPTFNHPAIGRVMAKKLKNHFPVPSHHIKK